MFGLQDISMLKDIIIAEKNTEKEVPCEVQCRYCKSDDETINKIDMEGEVDFRLNFGRNGHIETELIMGLGDKYKKPYLEVYRFYTKEKRNGKIHKIYDEFDKSMQVPIYFCPFCGRKL